MNGSDWLSSAIADGIRFLRRGLDAEAGGLWRDFAIPGVSAGTTECVSAFISAQIGAIPEGRALAAQVVRTIVSHPRQTGGWGYREDVPEDCDSTAWVLLAAAATGTELPPALLNRATSFLVEHQRNNGGFATYEPTAKASLTPADQPGWFEPEVSVTSSAVWALATTGYAGTEHLRAGCRYIAQACQDGLWESYWWKGFGYPTHLALCALRAADHARFERQLAATARAIRARRSALGGWANEPRSPDNGFSTSFALRALLLTDPDADRQSLLHLSGLMSTTSAEMLAPGAAAGADILLRDCGNVTIAAAVRTLHEARTGLAL